MKFCIQKRNVVQLGKSLERPLSERLVVQIPQSNYLSKYTKIEILQVPGVSLVFKQVPFPKRRRRDLVCICVLLFYRHANFQLTDRAWPHKIHVTDTSKPYGKLVPTTQAIRKGIKRPTILRYDTLSQCIFVFRANF